MGRKSEVNQIEVLSLFKKHKSTLKVADLLNIKRYQVHWVLKKNGIRSSIEEGHRKYTANYNYFQKIDTEEKAYWLGFLYADGCVTSVSKNSKRLTLALKSDDVEHVISFKKALQSTHPVYQKTIKTGMMQGKKYCRFSINSLDLCNDLIRKGCTERKSLTLTFPTLKASLKSAFIRGYFDGDGSVFTSVEKHWRNNKESVVIHYRFLGTLSFLEKVKEEIGLKGNIRAIKDNQTYELSYKRNKQLMSFYNFLYNKSSVFLKRKKEIFDKYIQERCSETIISHPSLG